MGDNWSGQLGLGHNNNQNMPQQIDFFKNMYVRKIICRRYHTIAITETKEVYSWGRNDKCQLGLAHNDNQNTPQKVDFFTEEQMVTRISKVKSARSAISF